MKKSSKKVESNMILIWGKVGFIMHLAQLIEYNLASILAMDEILRGFADNDSIFIYEFNELAEKSNYWADKLEKMPFGKIKEHAKQVKFFTDDSIKVLEKVVEKRNFIAHRFFKEDLIKQHFEKNPEIYFAELESIIALFDSVNEDLLKISTAQKEEYKTIY